MNAPYPIPGGTYSSNVYFFASSANNLGAFTKYPTDNVMVTVDYTQLTPEPTITGYWFTVDIGSAPPLSITNPVAGASTLEFIVGNGVPGVTYTVSVGMTFGQQARTDTFEVSIPMAPGCGCGAGYGVGAPSVPNNQGQFVPGEGTVFYNDIPRYFISGVAPQGPNLMDQWYDTTNNTLYTYMSTGATSQWFAFNSVPVTLVTQTVYTEKLNVTALNIVSPLTKAPNGAMVELAVNGVAFFPVGLTPPFHLSGQNIVWTSTIYSINPGDEVIAVYTYNTP